MNERTLLRFYSMTKPIVSVCAMVAYERGLFQLDEPISIHLPGFAKPRVVLPGGGSEPAAREITFRDLLTHTAGLAYGDSEHAVDEAYREVGCGWDAPYKLTLEEFVDRIGALPLAYQPGSSWRYSYATDVLGRLLEVVTGLPLDELLAQEIFGPLGMVDSGFHVPQDKLGRFAALYEVDEEETEAAAAASEDRRRFERHHTNAAAAAAAATATTTATTTATAIAMASAETSASSLPSLPIPSSSSSGNLPRRASASTPQRAAPQGRDKADRMLGSPRRPSSRPLSPPGTPLRPIRLPPSALGDVSSDTTAASASVSSPASPPERPPTMARRFRPLTDEGVTGQFTRRPEFVSAGGGLVSSAADFARFCQMLLNRGELDGVRLLSRKTVEFMTSNHLPLDAAGRRVDIDTIATDSGFSETAFDGIGFGLGWSVMTDPVKAQIVGSAGEYGWGGWASTFFSIDPKEELALLSLAQIVPSDRYPIRRQLRCLVYQTLVS